MPNTTDLEITIYVPPEVYGLLSIAQRHLDAAKASRWKRPQSRAKRSQRRHLSKVQKLVAKAARMIGPSVRNLGAA